MNHQWPRLPGALHNHLGKAVEEAALGLLVRLLAVWIAIAHANYASFSFNFESHKDVGIGHREPILVDRFHSDDCDVLAIGRYLRAICREHDTCCGPCCAASFCRSEEHT